MIIKHVISPAPFIWLKSKFIQNRQYTYIYRIESKISTDFYKIFLLVTYKNKIWIVI